MAIVCSCLPSPNFISGPSNHHKRDFRLPAVASQIDVGHLESEFRAPGITFSGIGDSCVVRMGLENGNAATLMLPDGLVTSFKAQMWHGATMELLHTFVSAKENGTGAVIQGGLSLALDCQNDAGFSWFPNSWSLHQVNGTPQESIQVELLSRNERGDAQVKHIITLGRDLLTSEILVLNSTTSALRLKGSVICHLAVSTPDATYALGLQGSDFFTRPPLETNFSIIPPNFTRSDRSPGKLWAFNKLFARNQNFVDDAESLAREAKQELEGEEEDDNYKHLTEILSRIYTSAPRNLTIMDRGRRNSVTARRNGFKEVYMFSPGSKHEWYNKYSYICVGHAALLESIILDSQSEWRGGMQLWNPNS